MKRAIIYFAIATALAIAGFLGLARAMATLDAARFQEDRAMAVARSVAWVSAQEFLREDDDAEGLTQRFVDATVKSVDGIEQIFVLKGTKFTVHSDSELTGKRLDRESEIDKSFYDALLRIKANVKKNDEERERRPDLKRDPYAEVEFTIRGDGAIAVVAPVEIEGKFKAVARVVVRAIDAEPTPPWALLGLMLGALFVFAAAAKVMPARARVAAGACLVLAVVTVGIHGMADWRDNARQGLWGQHATTLGQLDSAGLVAAAAPDEIQTLVATLARTRQSEPTGGLTAIRAGDAVDGMVLVDVGNEAVACAVSFFSTHRDVDLWTFTKWGVGFGILALLIFVLGDLGWLGRAGRGLVSHRSAYGYLSPAGVGMLILVFVPVVYGIALGFAKRQYNDYAFVGLANYLEILSDFDVSDPRNFYFKLGVTVMWTVANVGLHVSIGLILALILNDKMLKARGIYRVILIIPWAIPNYITALIWKGMFHRQFGAVNFFLEGAGMEPVAWFQSFWPAFMTNLTTNTWLGFPFMMVVSLGALQSIPTDLYEAAWVDGATRWQRFWKITLPLLMPALVPAVIVGTVWTFNMFNIIYLVSGGAPNGATDILITDAYRWAFERDMYGYAAAYSTVIFIILLGFTLVTNRITGATKGAFE